MAKAYKCDICGKFYENKETQVIRAGSNDSYVVYDACPDCMDSFRFWMGTRRHDYKSAFEDKEDGVMSKSGRVFIE